MNTKVRLIGSGMSVPRLGEPYTITIQTIEIWNADVPGGYPLETAKNDEAGRKRQGAILGRKKVHWKNSDTTSHRFTHTFSKITAIEDLESREGKRAISINGVSPKICGSYVEAEIGYPHNYNPPKIT